MAFKAEELMIQVLPSQWMWAACHGKEGGYPGDASHPASDCQKNSQKPCCEENTCRRGTHPASGCQENTRVRCPGDHGTCQNNTKKTQAGNAGSSGLDLLRHQMRERLSQELPC